jgi:hypothetical protein
MTAPAAPVLDTGTKLAVDRTRLAYERTMMAWVRTGLSLISFGFTVYKFFDYEVQKGAGDAAGTALTADRAPMSGGADIYPPDSLIVAHVNHQTRRPLRGGGPGRAGRRPPASSSGSGGCWGGRPAARRRYRCR